MSFGDRNFVPRRGEKRRHSKAKARLFNEVLVQKIIGEIMKLFFNRYLKTLGYYLFCVVILMACGNNANVDDSEAERETTSLELTLDQANHLASFGFHCIDTEYPNKMGQVLGGEKDLRSPSSLHPSFYGCFDWHSAVHGHWALIRLLKSFPNLNKADSIRIKMSNHINKDNISREVEYLNGKHSKSFERTYGWAWLLKLAEELYTWDDPQAQIWYNDLQPLTELIVSRYLEFLPKLTYPIRVGEHSNTAFGLAFAYDYAKTVGHDSLTQLIQNRARDFYADDMDCPLTWEPSGFDFLSPCLQEAFLMKKILPRDEFNAWSDDFFGSNLEKLVPAVVSDRSDGKLVHLDGLNFSRAWCLYGISQIYNRKDNSLRILADRHLIFSFDKMSTGDYAGEHWLASFALYALTQKSISGGK